MSAEKARALGLTPLATIKGYAFSGLEPAAWASARPTRSPRRSRRPSGRREIDLFEINEAFAAQVLACDRVYGLPMDKLNVNGGAIALGHPLGGSGVRISITLLHEMRRRGTRYGLAGTVSPAVRVWPRSSRPPGSREAHPTTTLKEREMTDVVNRSYSALQLIELSHVRLRRPVRAGTVGRAHGARGQHHQHGVLAWRVTTSRKPPDLDMNAPIHMVQRGDDRAAVSPDRLFGNAAVLDVPRESWEVITAVHQAASPSVEDGDIVVIVMVGTTSTPTASSTLAKLRVSTKDAAELGPQRRT